MMKIIREIQMNERKSRKEFKKMNGKKNVKTPLGETRNYETPERIFQCAVRVRIAFTAETMLTAQEVIRY